MNKQKQIDFLKKVFELPASMTDKIRELPDRVTETEKIAESKYELFCDWSGKITEAKIPDDHDLFFNKKQLPTDYRLVSNAEGKISKILMTYPSYERGQTMYKDYLSDLLKALPDTDFYIFSEAIKNEKDISVKTLDLNKPLDLMAFDLYFLKVNAPNPKRKIHFLHANYLANISFWVEDPFVIRSIKDKSGNTQSIYLVEPYHFMRAGDEEIADIIDKLPEYDNVKLNQIRAGLYFQGGNMLVGDKFVFLGKDYVHCTSNYLKICRPDWNKDQYLCNSTQKDATEIEYLYQYALDCERQAIILGSEEMYKPSLNHIEIDNALHVFHYGSGRFQPFYHIDLFITLVGRLTDDGPYHILVAQPYNVSDRSYPALNKVYFDPLRDRLDEIAIQIENIVLNGKANYFKVVRNPLPVTRIRNTDNDYLWRPLSYNNCLVENTKDKKVVYMPTYGTGLKKELDEGITNIKWLEPFDEWMAWIWEEQLCFKVKRLRNYMPLMVNGGAVNCITKFLERQNDQAPSEKLPT